MANVKINFSGVLTTTDPREQPVIIIGQMKNLQKISFNDVKIKLEPRVTEEVFNNALSNLHPFPTDTCPLYMNLAVIAALPIKCSRHNTPSRSHSITKIVKNFLSGVDESIVIVCEREDAFASACAVARAFSLYSRKSGQSSHRNNVNVEFLLVGASAKQPLTQSDFACMSDATYGIQLTARIVDAPCSEMHTDGFLQEIYNVGKTLGITPLVIQGEDLNRKGFGGIYGVGKAASRPPALAILSHTPEGAKQTIAWVGKGIVYDTGGLCIKAKTAMVSMKRDCGGAAAILGAFYAAVKQGFKENLHAVFCLAENAVGPLATRPDDIHTLYSGRTVEINNTDAEGRLVLGDGVCFGVAYAFKDLKATIILDMATLTGAQGTATGKYHAALITNNEEWEVASVKAGQASGDLIHPLPYCPELHFSEFASSLADMKNSVADRSNAQSSCAGLFIASHIGFDFAGSWIHVDMAYPVHCGERATGYGVALLLTLFGQESHSTLLQSISPLRQENGVQEDGCVSKKMRLL
uniref:Cytosol aminopeptidase domain-containing protein n=1 Tax=Strigamia maritima TaxID=126957 RepID=T1J675_STRMM